ISAHGSPEGSAGVTIDSVTVEDCQIGLAVDGPANQRSGMGAQISNCQLIDNRVGISLFHAFSFISDTVIRDDESTPPASLVGISIDSGDSFLDQVEIVGQNSVGLDVHHSPSDDRNANAFGDGLVITGGEVGIACSGIDNQLHIRNSIVRDQTAASLALS